MAVTPKVLRVALGAAAVVLASAVVVPAARVADASNGFNKSRDVLITDQFNNRVVEVNPHTKAIVWSFGSNDPTACNPGPGTIIAPNYAERVSGGLTLIAGTGTSSCADNRVIAVDQAGNIVWQYGQAGVAGSGPNQLNVPVSAIQLPNRDILITDQANNRVIQVDRFSKKVVWSYGPTSGRGALSNPNSAELLPNGHILIADESNNRVIEITRGGRIVWQYGSGNPLDSTPLEFAAFASRLPNGDTLITDSGHARVIEVTPDKHVVFSYFTNTGAASNPSPLPTNAVQLANGHIWIADQFNDRALEIGSSGNFIDQIGQTNVIGNGFDQLNAPYTAFSIGDYTGQTPPPSQF